MALAKGPGPSRGGMVASGELRARREVPRRRALATRFSSFKNPLFARNPVERFSGSRLKVSRAPVSGILGRNHESTTNRAGFFRVGSSHLSAPGTMADAAAAGGDAKKLPEGYVNKNSEKALLGVFSSAGYIDVGNKVRPERARAVGIAWQSPKCVHHAARIPPPDPRSPLCDAGQAPAVPREAPRALELHRASDDHEPPQGGPARQQTPRRVPGQAARLAQRGRAVRGPAEVRGGAEREEGWVRDV